MGSFIGCGSSSCHTRTVSSSPVRMCRIFLLLLVAATIQVSTSIPPRLFDCRNIFKARVTELTFTLQDYETCGQVSITFPLVEGDVRNFTDHRNCANYFSCKMAACHHCPCPTGETFNPGTGSCDSTNSACECPTTTTSTTTVATTTILAVNVPVTRKPGVVVKDAGIGKQNGDNSDTSANPPVSTEVIIIAGIVSATVIVIVVIVMAVFCWQRRQTDNINIRMSKPSPAKLSTTPSHDNGYSASMPPSMAERHEYAEIDEKMIHGQRHWQHGSSVRGKSAPPLPNHQPPHAMQPSYNGPCPVHHHSHTDSGLGLGSTDTTFNYPKGTFSPINPANSIRIGVSYNEREPQAQCCGEEIYHDRGDSSMSSDSQYSQSSHPTSIDSHDVDIKTPLALAARPNYISKQVYI